MKPLIVPRSFALLASVSCSRNFWRLLSRVGRLSPGGIGENPLAFAPT
jgi:hypothetical protein